MTCVIQILVYILLLASARPVLAQTSLLPDLKAARATIAAPTREHVGALLNAVAWQHRHEWGLLRKESGNNCPTPAGVLVACDILMHRPSSRIFDVLGDVDGTASPQWGEAHGSPTDPARFVAPVDPGTIDGGGKSGGGAGGNAGNPELLEQLTAALVENTEVIRRLWEFLGGMHQRLIEIERQNHELRQQLEALKKQAAEFTWPTYEGRNRLLGTFTLTPK